MYTSTTELYTYLHTLSLHGALPIEAGDIADVEAGGWRLHREHSLHRWHQGLRVDDADLLGGKGRRQSHDALCCRPVRRQGHPNQRCCPGDHRNRSEEHTSELQSLMRISYDDFCLQKKNMKTN